MKRVTPLVALAIPLFASTVFAADPPVGTVQYTCESIVSWEHSWVPTPAMPPFQIMIPSPTPVFECFIHRFTYLPGGNVQNDVIYSGEISSPEACNMQCAMSQMLNLPIGSPPLPTPPPPTGIMNPPAPLDPNLPPPPPPPAPGPLI